MKPSFKQFLEEKRIGGGGGKPTGAEFENIICVAYNMKNLKQSKDQAIKSAETEWKPKFDDWLDIGEKIVNNIGLFSGKMKHFGASHAPLNNNWEKYFIQTTGRRASAATKTPKTDIYIGNNRISLKKYGGSQLMSGGAGETLATLAAAYENIPNSVKSKELDKAWTSLANKIEKEFTRFKLPSGKQINDYKKAIESGVDDELTNFIKQKLDGQREMTDALRNLLSTPEVNIEVVREAMTGNKKFKDTLPKASHIMKFDESGKSSFILIDDKYVSYVASQTQFNISFKTAGTGKNAWTATKGIFAEAFEYAYSEEMLQEGIFGTVANKVKSGVQFLMNVVRKMLSYIWSKVKSLLMSGMNKVQEILGVKLVVSNGNPMVKF